MVQIFFGLFYWLWTKRLVRKRSAAHGFKELTKDLSINLQCVYLYAMCIEGASGPACHHAASCETFIIESCRYASNRFDENQFLSALH